MRISDWSSDVCSSDLSRSRLRHRGGELRVAGRHTQNRSGASSNGPLNRRRAGEGIRMSDNLVELEDLLPQLGPAVQQRQIGDSLGKEADKLKDSDKLICRLAAVLEIARETDFDADSRSEEHTSELQSLMRTSYAVFCLKKKKK